MVRTDTNTKNESHQEAKVIQHLSLIKGITLVEARNGKGLDRSESTGSFQALPSATKASQEEHLRLISGVGCLTPNAWQEQRCCRPPTHGQPSPGHTPGRSATTSSPTQRAVLPGQRVLLGRILLHRGSAGLTQQPAARTPADSVGKTRLALPATSLGDHPPGV